MDEMAYWLEMDGDWTFGNECAEVRKCIPETYTIKLMLLQEKIIKNIRFGIRVTRF